MSACQRNINSTQPRIRRTRFAHTCGGRRERSAWYCPTCAAQDYEIFTSVGGALDTVVQSFRQLLVTSGFVRSLETVRERVATGLSGFFGKIRTEFAHNSNIVLRHG